MEKGYLNMDKRIDIAMTKLFQLAEYVCSKCSSVVDESAVNQEVAPTIRFANEDKAEIKRVESDASIHSFEREQSQLKIKMVEGELFN
jgi:transcription initiation factor TFIIIB Brf1 subunit/transcription initiation factor TFIIB